MKKQFTLEDLKNGQIHTLDPLEYSAEWVKPSELEVEMANGNIKVLRKPLQQDKFSITEDTITTERYRELYQIYTKRTDREFIFTDIYGNKCRVRLFSLKEPMGANKGFHTAILTFIVKERLVSVL